MKPTVTVVIPCYNEEEYIGRCLVSIAAQDEMPDEVIVVDNNCSDKTVQIAKSFTFVTIVKEKKQGKAHARNAGFNKAKSEIIARCDADTILRPTWVKHIRRIFKKSGIDGVTGPVDFYDLPLKPVFKNVTKTFFDIWKLIKKHHMLFGSNMAIRKAIWEKVGKLCNTNDDEVHEDIDLSVKIAAHGGSIIFDKDLQASISARRYIKKPLTLPHYTHMLFNSMLEKRE